MSLRGGNVIYTFSEPGVWDIQLRDGTLLGQVTSPGGGALGRPSGLYFVALETVTGGDAVPADGWAEAVSMIGVEAAQRDVDSLPVLS